MTGTSQTGESVDYCRRRLKKAVPMGPLSQRQIVDIQAIVAQGLTRQGYTRHQVAQIMNTSLRTTERRAAKPYV